MTHEDSDSKDIRFILNAEESYMIVNAINVYVHSDQKDTPEFRSCKKIFNNIVDQLEAHKKHVHLVINRKNMPDILPALAYTINHDKITQFLPTNEAIALKHAYTKVNHYLKMIGSIEKPISVTQKQLTHDASLVKHSFTREALDDIFKGLHFTHSNKAYYNTVLSKVAMVTMNNLDIPYKNADYVGNLFMIKMTLIGLKNALKNPKSPKSNASLNRLLISKFKQLQNDGYKYATGVSIYHHDKQVKYLLTPIKSDVCLYFIKILQRDFK